MVTDDVIFNCLKKKQTILEEVQYGQVTTYQSQKNLSHYHPSPPHISLKTFDVTNLTLYDYVQSIQNSLRKECNYPVPITYLAEGILSRLPQKASHAIPLLYGLLYSSRNLFQQTMADMTDGELLIETLMLGLLTLAMIGCNPMSCVL